MDCTEAELELLVRDVWHYKRSVAPLTQFAYLFLVSLKPSACLCAVRSAGNGNVVSFQLTRWRRDASPTLDNLVLLTVKEVNAIDVSLCC